MFGRKKKREYIEEEYIDLQEEVEEEEEDDEDSFASVEALGDPIQGPQPLTRPEEEVPKQPVFIPSEVTVVGHGITLVGDFISEEPIEINGVLKGNVVSSSTVHVAKDGLLQGGAKAFELQVDGNVEGSSVIKTYSIISDTGSYRGKLQTGLLRTAPDAFFEGQLSLPAVNRTQSRGIAPAISSQVMKQEEAAAAFDELFKNDDSSESISDATVIDF